MHELISDQNWWWWWTQSNDPISCYGTPVERTNEIKAYAISLSIPLVYRSNWSDCRTESDSRSRPKPWSVQSGSASWDDCGRAFLDKLRASLFSTLCWNSIATPLHFFIFAYETCVPVGSPSRGGDVTVYVKDVNQPSSPTPFHFVLVSISVLWPVQLYFIP